MKNQQEQRKQLQQQKESLKLQEKAFIKLEEKSKRNFFLGCATLVVTGLGVVIHSQSNALQQYFKQKKQKQKYGVVYPVMTEMDTWLIQKSFPNNQTRNDLKNIMFTKMNGNAPLRIITGMPGNGKTTEIKQLVKQLRKQGHIVYYHNLRDQADARDIQIKQEKIKLVSELFGLLKLFYSQRSRPSQGKLVYLVIDGINMLESSENNPDLAQEIKLFWVHLAAVSQIKTHRAIVISSSSSYMSALEHKSYVQKESEFFHLKMKTDQEMKQAIKNIFDFHFREKKTDSSQYGETIQYLVEQRYTLRQVRKIIPRVERLLEDDLQKKISKGASDDQSFLQKFKMEQKRNISREFITTGKQIITIYEKLKKEQRQYNKLLLQKILKVEKSNKDTCLEIKESLTSMRANNYKLQDKKTLDEILEEKNLLFYCYPRTEKSRRILQLILADMK